jgi:hypothetical protein
MSSITLAHTAEKAMTVATAKAISSFADSRQGRLEGRLAVSVRRPNGIACSNPS